MPIVGRQITQSDFDTGGLNSLCRTICAKEIMNDAGSNKPSVSENYIPKAETLACQTQGFPSRIQTGCMTRVE
jgi:hypothetical protein